MGREVSRVAVRCVLVLALAGLVAGIGWLLVAETLVAVAHIVLADGTPSLVALPFDAALSGLCCLALLGCAGWLAMVTGLVAVEALAGATGRMTTAPLAGCLCPAALRRLILVGCGVAITAGMAGSPALATSADPATDRRHSALVGLPVPDRAVEADTLPLTHVRVGTGDCLWKLAEQALPANADNSAISAAWRAIHRANLDRIGADPDLVLPGTLLQIPDLYPPRPKEPS